MHLLIVGLLAITCGGLVCPLKWFVSVLEIDFWGTLYTVKRATRRAFKTKINLFLSVARIAGRCAFLLVKHQGEKVCMVTSQP